MAMAEMTSGIGLEIGPLDKPIVLKATANVRYVDIVGTAALVEKYRDDPSVDAAGLAEVDFALQDPEGRIRTLPEVTGGDGPFDWVVASHVIEHVPDLIAWFDELAQVTVDGGHLVLLIPDRRFTFDALRPRTTVGQMLQAHTDGDVVPSERAVYDHFRSYVDVSAKDLWSGSSASQYPRVFTVDQASQLRTQRLETGEYLDSHVWTFTPVEFVEQVVELGMLGLCDFVVEHIEPTLADDLEFLVLLRRLPRGATEEAKREEQASSIHPEDVVEGETPMGRVDPERPSFLQARAESGALIDSGIRSVLVSEREWKVIRMKRRAMGVIRNIVGAGRAT